MINKIIYTIGILLFITSCGEKPAESINETQPIAVEKQEKAQGVIDKPIELTKAMFLQQVANFETNPTQWIYLSDKPSIIDFYATWCGPCKITAPILDELAKEYAGKIYIYKVDTDKEKELAMAFGIQNLPTFVYCPMKGAPQVASGIARTNEETKAMFKQYIEEVLLKEE